VSNSFVFGIQSHIVPNLNNAQSLRHTHASTYVAIYVTVTTSVSVNATQWVESSIGRTSCRYPWLVWLWLLATSSKTESMRRVYWSLSLFLCGYCRTHRSCDHPGSPTAVRSRSSVFSPFIVALDVVRCDLANNDIACHPHRCHRALLPSRPISFGFRYHCDNRNPHHLSRVVVSVDSRDLSRHDNLPSMSRQSSTVNRIIMVVVVANRCSVFLYIHAVMMWSVEAWCHVVQTDITIYYIHRQTREQFDSRSIMSCF